MTFDDFAEYADDNPAFDRMSDDWFDDFADILMEMWEYMEEHYGEDWLEDWDYNDGDFWDIFGELYDTVFG